MIIQVKKIQVGEERSGVSEFGKWCYTTCTVEWELQDNPATAPYTQSLVVEIKGRVNREAIEATLAEHKPIAMWLNMKIKEHKGTVYNNIRGSFGEEFILKEVAE